MYICLLLLGPCKVRNEIETKRSISKRGHNYGSLGSGNKEGIIDEQDKKLYTDRSLPVNHMSSSRIEPATPRFPSWRLGPR